MIHESDRRSKVEKYKSKTKPYIAVGNTKRDKSDTHAVVFKDGELLFDPYPNGNGLNGDPLYYIAIFTPEEHQEFLRRGPSIWKQNPT